MVVKRKKKTIDGIDRDVLRFLRSTNRTPTSRQIAQKVNLSGASIMPRLNNLKSQGIIKDVKCGKMRTFDRRFGNRTIKIKAPSMKCWGLNLKPRKKKK